MTRPIRAGRARAPNNPVRGIALLVLGLCGLSISDLGGKLLNAGLPPPEIAWLRYIVFNLMMAAVAWRSPEILARPGSVTLQVARGAAVVLSAVSFIAATRLLPLATATTICFVSPLFIATLSIPLLGERVDLRRWVTILVGLVGVLIVVRPTAASFQAASLLPILSAAFWAVSIILTRRSTDRVMTTVLWTAAVGVVLLSLAQPFVFLVPDVRQLGLAVMTGLGAGLGQILVAAAYSRAQASLLAPFAYTQLIWSTLFDLLFFGRLPDRWTIAGAAIITASGIYTFRREWKTGSSPADPLAKSRSAYAVVPKSDD